MKIEKIDYNKVMITMSFEELEDRNISLKDIENNNKLAKDIFTELIQESNIDELMDCDNSQLFVEAKTTLNNTLNLMITKLDEKILPDSFNNTEKINIEKNCARLNHLIFEFTSLDEILNFCNVVKKENLFFGTNSLYKYNDSKYFITFGEKTTKNKKFKKTNSIISEFCIEKYSSNLYRATIIEKCSLIIKNRALQKLSRI